jgi:hypothetical protein
MSLIVLEFSVIAFVFIFVETVSFFSYLFYMLYILLELIRYYSLHNCIYLCETVSFNYYV